MHDPLGQTFLENNCPAIERTPKWSRMNCRNIYVLKLGEVHDPKGVTHL